MLMKNRTILLVIILGAIAIIGIIGMQTYWVVNTWNNNEEEFNQKVHLALYNVALSLSKLQDATLPTHSIVKQRTTNYYVVNIANEIDPGSLEYFLQKELEALALNIDFEYAVFDCHTNEMVYGSYCSYSPEKKADLELGNLPKYSEFTYYFGVKFPTRPNYLFSKMQISLLLSVLLLITVVFFAYSMFVILTQKRLSEMQKDFINNMTHEFKTPISTIKISADVFLNNPQVQQDHRLMQYAGIIKEQNQRLNNQVENVLQLAKIEQRNFELNPEDIDLHALMNDVATATALHIEKLGGHFKTDFAPVNIHVRADRLHLSNVLHNLLDNALKYCKKTPHIEFSTRKQGSWVEIVVSDNGIGISKEQQEKVFEKFYRVPTGNVHDVKGFGLGLFYVKSICKKHGWKLILDSEIGKGTTVRILIETE
jgi:two-component system phosphate regulon sensor histidine kinase PhoR